MLLSGLLSPDDLLDHERLADRLRIAVDDPVHTGLWRAWHEAVLDEADLARFQAEWRADLVKDLAGSVAEARRRSPSNGRRVAAPVVAWSIMTLARQLAIHDRLGAPDVGELAQLFQDLIFGTIIAA